MAAQEVFHAGVEEEVLKDVPREAEHHDEGHQGTARAANHQMAKVSPVALRLFTGQCAQAQVGFRLRARPMTGNDGAEAAFAAAIAAFPHHGVQAAGGQRRELGQHLADERQIGVDLRWPLRRAAARQTRLCQHPGNSFGMHAQLPGDGSDTPLFDVVIAQNLRLEIRWNRHDRVLFVCSDGPGVAGSLAVRVLNSNDRSPCSAIPACAQTVGCPGAIAGRQPKPDPPPAEHSPGPGGNRDAALYFAACRNGVPGSGATAPHG